MALLLPAAPAAAQPQQSPPPIVQPGAPGEPSHEISAEKATDLSKVGYTEADVQFMQGMIHHHAQAVQMVDLLKTRTRSDDMKKLAERIEISQRDEIKMMRHWLQARGQEAPDPFGGMHDGMDMSGMKMDGPLMPGMLTPEEMQQLAAASGPAFDRLFLTGMIKHHGGALTMVKQLFATPAAGQESDIFAFASDVNADQRMEIDRMSAMLRELEK
jgi:uncharacterized protein (DUF305 family)